MKKVSVIIPIYNMEKYLSKCLDSVVSQSFYNSLEIVCINDGSSDSSLQILQEYAAHHNNLIIINQNNSGVGIARNNGIQHATGEFIAFMDPDDYYLEPDTLELLYSSAIKHNVMICGGSLSEDHNNGKWIRKEFEGIYKKYTFSEEKLIAYSDYQFDFGFYRFIYNRKFLIQNNIYFPPLIRFQDPPFFVKAMITAKQFYAIPNYTYCYRYGHQNIIWHEERICALIKGHIENLKLSSSAGLGELHALTLHRLVNISKDCIIQGFLNNSHKVIHLLEEAERCINTDILPSDSSIRSVHQFYFNYFKKAEETEELLKKLSMENNTLLNNNSPIETKHSFLNLLKKQTNTFLKKINKLPIQKRG